LPPPAVMLRAIQQEKARRAAEAELKRVTQNADAIRQRCETFSGFVREAWHVLEPTNPLKWSWHLDAMCEHLEAISRGKMSPWLAINVPPGSSKSTIVSVMWQAWEWGPLGRPSSRFLTTSFEEENVKRDTRKTRDLIASDWYQALWPDVVFIRKGETSFANSATGTREGVPFASITGKRGDRVVIDDPHSLDGAESETERNKATRRFLEGGLNRVNDQTTSAIVVVMQRLHEADLTGVLLSRQLGFVHLMIPMEFEPERRCSTAIGWRDPRSFDGELMDPVRMPREAVERLKGVSAYAWAGQYQQRPAAREGAMFKRHWFEGKIIRQAPAGTVWVRHWDLAATAKKTSARTAGVKMGRTPDGKYVVGHVTKTQDEGAAVRSLILGTAQVDGRECEISLPQDPGQAGKVQKQDMIAMLAGFNARAQPETGDKITRAEPFSAQCEAGNVFLVEGAWINDYLDELCMFPAGMFKDQVDASSGAFGRLVKPQAAPALFATYASRRG
jgi:predicted phage terminase large subunit-like protein